MDEGRTWHISSNTRLAYIGALSRGGHGGRSGTEERTRVHSNELMLLVNNMVCTVRCVRATFSRSAGVTQPMI